MVTNTNHRSYRIRSLALPAVVLIVALSGCLSGGDGGINAASEDAAHEHIRMLAVEWKGGTNVASEPYPGPENLPPGVGYGMNPPDANGRWEVNAYRWDPGFVVVHSGNTVTLNIFGVNGAHHDSEIEGHDVHFNVTRGSFTEVTFVAGEPGTYRILCHTHAPAMEGTLLVLPAPTSSPGST